MLKKWPKIASILKKHLSPGQYKVWVAPLVPVREGAELVFFAPSEFAADFVRSRFLLLLEEAVNAVMGTGCTVSVRYCPQAQSGGSTRHEIASGLVIRPGEVVSAAFPEQPLMGLAGKPSPMPDAKADPLFSICAGGAFSIPLSSYPPKRVVQMNDLPPVTMPVPSPRPLPAPRPLPVAQLSLPMASGTPPRPRNTQNWRFSFEDFVVGPCNELAFAASRSLCDDMLHTDILFLSSAPGLGKTHLMQAVGKGLGACCNHHAAKVEYLTAEEFASQFFYALKGQQMDTFKARFRMADILLLEDVHFLQGKEKMQAELLATIKALRERGSKVVFTSSFVPRDLKMLDDQLQSRLCAGLLAVIDKPDEAMRRKIIRSKASLHQMTLPEDVEDALVRYIHADVRQIESCLQNLILKARLLNTRISLQMALEVMSHYAAFNPVLDMEAIVEHVCRGFGISREKLFSSSRKQECVVARNTAFFLARKHTDLSLASIGRQFNRRHSTVLKGITNLEREMGRQTPLGRQLANILSMVERTGNILRVEQHQYPSLVSPGM